ncbi:NTP transferase domain-containing protein [Corynebacterium terpenotabidum]|uniref:Molybdopterin-guanine dinucleotide biosynthesis protein A n=1 Tax=Corynebacterium terpenotabidum Y-11 TaxID=1200352 RepID=S4XG60_9CORY|nr:NTP transferase domain-containing protein [Corynebacterium terpenotabidum]AGP31564.1 molybdopterin-guanine dinucleotide biosynthesis protein A [Corynebacterium terpenotabidum Y-11]
MYALIIAGGRGERVAESAPEPVPVKPLLEDATGRRLIDRAVDACRDAELLVVVAGEMDLPEGVVRVREDPPLAGPAAGIAAGVAALPGDDTDDTDVLVIPADLADPAAVVASLTAPGVITAGGRLQPMLFRAPLPALRDACAGDLTDAPVMRILRHLDLPAIDLPEALVADIDTWADAVAHGYGRH